MPSGLRLLYKAELSQRREPCDGENGVVDIVAVHGLNEDMIEAWTHPETGTLWLRDLLPREAILVARVLTFGYDASPSSFRGVRCADTIQKHAHTLVASLQADRSIEGCDYRPIIFVCHGLGGLLVKKALAYSESRTSSQVQHLHYIFISTYAILFFGTPHNHVNIGDWLALESAAGPGFSVRGGRIKKRTISPQKDDIETLRMITDHFAPLMKRFHIYFFWEGVPSKIGDRLKFLVEENSAAPNLDNTERCGIDATHSNMVKFSTSNSSSYKTVIAALSRYCNNAPTVIARRQKVALEALARVRRNEASELAGLSIDMRDDRLSSDMNVSEKPRSKHFDPPLLESLYFTGRHDVSEILQRALFSTDYNPSTSGQRRFVIHGLAGCGKTELCSKFARDNKDRYFGVFTIQAENPKAAKESFAKIGKMGGLEATESAGKHWLSQLTEPWLLIIDNADNRQLVLKDLFPYGDRGHILITTRNRDFRNEGTAGSLELKGLKEDEALDLLLKRADIPRPWDTSTERAGQEISKAMGYLAIALVQAGTSISKKICDLKDYLNFYYDYWSKRRALSRSAAEDITNDDGDIVYTAFDISFGYLTTKNTTITRDAVELLNIVGFYHFEHIRVDIFTRAVENRRKITSSAKPTTARVFNAVISRFQPPQILPRFLKDNAETLQPYRVREALHELYALSLINYDGKDASFSLHPLVHDWARDRLSQGEKAIWGQIALNTLAESILLPPDDRGEGDAQYRRDLLPHLDECLAACPVRIDNPSGRFNRLHLSFAKVFQQTLLFILSSQAVTAAKCGYVYAERGRFTEGALYLSMVKEVLVQTLGYEHEKTTVAMLGLAGTCWGLGRLEEAIALQKRVVEARSKVLGPEHHDTLLAMDQLGRSFWLHGQYQEALHLQQVTTARMKATLGASHSDTLAALDNLGVTLGSWHRFQDSMEIHKQVLLLRQQRLGNTDPETLTTSNNLAMALLDLGRLTEAKQIMQEVVEQRQVKLGKEHPWTLWAICNLAKINIELNQLDEAERMLIDGIAAGKRSLSDDHLGVLMGCGELARVYARQGRLGDAESLTLNTLDRIEKSRGHEHPDCIYGLFKLAQLYELQGQIEKGAETCETALNRARRRLTTRHPLYAKIESLKRHLSESAVEGRKFHKVGP